MKNEFEIIGKCPLCGGDVTKRDIDWDMNGGSHFAWCGKCRLRSARATMHDTNEHLMELYYEACQRRKKKLLEKEILSKAMVIIDGNEFETKGLFTNWERTYEKEPKRNDFLGKAKCSNCGDIEYSFKDIQNETIENIFIEYILCPKCKNKIVLNEIDLSKPYVESETALHCLACGELLTKRIDKIDGFSWFVCKKCEERYNEKG